jgi:2'-5' RNA ligase
VRLFFAAFPGAELRRTISAAVGARGRAPDTRLAPPENYHMTLVFLGEVADSRVEAVRRVGEAQQFGRFPLHFDRWEYWSGSRALVASASHRSEPLLQLRAALAAGLGEIGATFDDKALHPHITVARKIAQAHVLPALSGFDWMISEFSLVASQRAALASVYTVIDTWPLLDIGESR